MYKPNLLMQHKNRKAKLYNLFLTLQYLFPYITGKVTEVNFFKFVIFHLKYIIVSHNLHKSLMSDCILIVSKLTFIC